jgi:hypothetical protein
LSRCICQEVLWKFELIGFSFSWEKLSLIYMYNMQVRMYLSQKMAAPCTHLPWFKQTWFFVSNLSFHVNLSFPTSVNWIFAFCNYLRGLDPSFEQTWILLTLGWFLLRLIKTNKRKSVLRGYYLPSPSFERFMFSLDTRSDNIRSSIWF